MNPGRFIEAHVMDISQTGGKLLVGTSCRISVIDE